jgi:hypothetical protein
MPEATAAAWSPSTASAGTVQNLRNLRWSECEFHFPVSHWRMDLVVMVEACAKVLGGPAACRVVVRDLSISVDVENVDEDGEGHLDPGWLGKRIADVDLTGQVERERAVNEEESEDAAGTADLLRKMRHYPGMPGRAPSGSHRKVFGPYRTHGFAADTNLEPSHVPGQQMACKPWRCCWPCWPGSALS